MQIYIDFYFKFILFYFYAIITVNNSKGFENVNFKELQFLLLLFTCFIVMTVPCTFPGKKMELEHNALRACSQRLKCLLL